MKKMGKEKFLPVGAAALSALLLWAAFPPMGETCAIAFALAPLLVVSRLCAPKKAMWTWFAGGFLFWFATLSWMPAISKNNGPLPLVILGWIGLAALCSAYFALFGWLSARAWSKFFPLTPHPERQQSCRPPIEQSNNQTIEQSPTPNPQPPAPNTQSPLLKLILLLFIEPVLWAGIEWLRSWLFTGFAWNFLGTAVAAVTPLAQPASFGGVYLVSALVVLLNGVFATLACRLIAQMSPAGVEELRSCDVETSGQGDVLAVWRMDSYGRWGRMLETALPLGFVLVVLMASIVDFRESTRGGDRSNFRVALVQRNAPCIFSKRDRAQDPYETFGRLLEAATVAKPDLVVWAESAMAEFGRLDSDGARHAALYFSRLTDGASLLAGGDWRQMVDGERRILNAAGLYTPTATNVELQVYGKQHLVPFGEFIPFDKWIPILQKLSPLGVSLWPGEAKVLDLTTKGGGTVKIAPLICFEDTDPVLARRAARMGAQAIVLITNDSWFSHSREAEQHAAQAVLRAVETGLPVIRVGNSGVTGVIRPGGWARWLEDGDGRKLVDAAGTMIETVQVRNSPRLTPYSRLGDIPLILLFATSLLGVFLVKSHP